MKEHIQSTEISHSELVRVGSVVEVQFIDEEDQASETIRIVERSRRQSDDGDTIPPVSLDSPLGNVILNAKVGDVISYGVPGGAMIHIRIVSVR